MNTLAIITIAAAMLSLTMLAGLSLGALVVCVLGAIYTHRIAKLLDNDPWVQMEPSSPPETPPDDEDGDRWKRGDYSAN